MTHLGTIEGYGQIIAGSNDLGEVGYSISVFQPRFMKEARGYITGPNKVLHAILQAGRVILALENGKTVDVIVTNYTMPGDRADITVYGRVPGF